MMKRVHDQCVKGFDSHIVVATDNDKIFRYCKSEKIDSIMTSTNCLTGTDRV